MAKAAANGEIGKQSEATRECEEYRQLYGKWVGLYGPNYIWTGRLVRETEKTIVLEQCQQVYETREHSASNADREMCAPFMIFPKSAICNIGETKWAAPN